MSYLTTLNAIIAGSGSAAFSCTSVAQIVKNHALKVRQLLNKQELTEEQKPVTVNYFGICTYESDAARAKQTDELVKIGCIVNHIKTTWPNDTPSIDSIRDQVLDGDVLLLSGGNTLYAMRRWKSIGMDKIVREAAEKGVIMSGGSAGMGFLFDGIHSDSADPTTFRPKQVDDPSVNVEAQSEKQLDAKNEDPENWKYLRVSCLGLLPGLACPHHDRTQSNGLPRFIDFDEMLKRHRTETGICLDHWCVMTITQGGDYELSEVEGMSGSLVIEGGRDHYQELKKKSSSSFLDSKLVTFHVCGDAIPALWIKEVLCVNVEGDLEEEEEKGSLKIELRACNGKGKLQDILKVCPAEQIVEENEAEDSVMKRNPI